MNRFSLQECYIVAWRSFKKWWIPLCLISGVILVFEIVPRIMLYPQTQAFKQFVIESAGTVITAFQTGDAAAVETFAVEFNERIVAYAINLIKLSIYAFPFVALLTVILLMFANRAVKEESDRNSGGRTLYITLTHVFLSCVKITSFLFCILPGFYIYVRLLFVSLVMLEDKTCGMIEAIRRSWVMTRGSFWELLGLVMINGVCQISIAPTVVGLIPVTGFANTARAAAYQMLKPNQKNPEETL